MLLAGYLGDNCLRRRLIGRLLAIDNYYIDISTDMSLKCNPNRPVMYVWYVWLLRLLGWSVVRFYDWPSESNLCDSSVILYGRWSIKVYLYILTIQNCITYLIKYFISYGIDQLDDSRRIGWSFGRGLEGVSFYLWKLNKWINHLFIMVNLLSDVVGGH